MESKTIIKATEANMMMINSDAPPPTFEASVLQAPPYTVHPTASTFAGKSANMFVSVGTGNHPFALFLRNDGAVVMTTNGQMPGIVINPPPGVRYTSVACGETESYVLRDDGAVDLLSRRCSGHVSVAKTIMGHNYIGVAIRRPTAYLLRENGMVDCVKRGGIVSKTIVPPSGEWRAPVVMRTSKGHLLRGDALLSERVSLSRGGSCSPLHSSGLAAKSPSTLYPCPSSRNEAHEGATMQYYVRSDGGVDCVRKNGRTTTIPAPEKSEYIASSATYGGGYLLRGDGAVDRILDSGRSIITMRPPSGVTYVQVSAGRSTAYLVRSDGRVDITTGYGRVKSTIEGEPLGPRRCACVNTSAKRTCATYE